MDSTVYLCYFWSAFCFVSRREEEYIYVYLYLDNQEKYEKKNWSIISRLDIILYYNKLTPNGLC